MIIRDLLRCYSALAATHAKCYMLIGMVYSLQNDYVRAIDYQMKALDTLSGIANMSEISITAYSNLANLYVKISDFPSAQSYLDKVLEVYRALGKENHAKVGQIHADMGAMHYSKQDYRDALNHFENVRQIWLKFMSSARFIVN